MAKIIMFGNQKGGVGKSTLTALTANAFAALGRSVTVLDVDQQQSLIKRRLSDLQGFEGSTPYRLEFKTLADFQRDIVELDGSSEFVFVDAPGKLDADLPPDQQQIVKLLQYVDFLFIPFVPGNYSLDASLSFLKTALKVKAQRSSNPRKLEVVGTVNMFEGSRTIDDRFLMDELDELRALVNIPFMDTPLNRYSLFRSVDTLESFYHPGTAEKAKANFTDWFDELAKIIG